MSNDDYLKKPVQVRAKQLLGSTLKDHVEMATWFNSVCLEGEPSTMDLSNFCTILTVGAAGARQRVTVGDWVIREAWGVYRVLSCPKFLLAYSAREDALVSPKRFAWKGDDREEYVWAMQQTSRTDAIDIYRWVESLIGAIDIALLSETELEQTTGVTMDPYSEHVMIVNKTYKVRVYSGDWVVRHESGDFYKMTDKDFPLAWTPAPEGEHDGA